MAIHSSGCYDYQTVLHAARGGVWTGIADDDGSESLVGSRPSVLVAGGRVTMTGRRRGTLTPSETSTASFDGGEALSAVLHEGDELRCWRGGTAEIGLSVTRSGSLVLGLGTLGRTPGGDITIDPDPRVEDTVQARDFRYLNRPGTRIVWLDPDRPAELEARLRQLDGDLAGVKLLAIVARTNDHAVRSDLNRRTMGRPRPRLAAMMFLTVEKRFSSLDEWLEYVRGLSPERPRDLWLRVRSGTRECLIPEGTTAMFEGWLVHVLRVYEPGLPGTLSQLGLVAADAGVTPAMLEGSTAAIAKGVMLA